MFAELAPVWFKQHFIHSWLLFAAAAVFVVVYFWVERLVNIIVDNWYDVIVVYLYFCMFNIFSGEFQVLVLV